MQNKNLVYFPNLDGIRFIAASLVCIHHIEQFKSIFGIESSWNNHLIRSFGKLGVILFFVLSGFLITYLLFLEESQSPTKQIDIKKFYFRRILRIWPLYFLIVFCALFVLPKSIYFNLPIIMNFDIASNVWLLLLLFIFFLPNLVLICFGSIPFASQTWSIGAEEQFYIFWPILIKYIKNKLFSIVSVFIIYILIQYFLIYNTLNYRNKNLLIKIWESIPFHFMAIGAFFAYIAFYNTINCFKIKKFFYSKIVQVVTFLLIIILLSFQISIRYLNLEVYAFLFAIIIFNAATNNNDNIFKLHNLYIRYLGRISYGLYMYHSICIVFVINIFNKYHIPYNNFYIYFISFLTTILLATISYYTFENYFFKLKFKYVNVKSAHLQLPNET